MVFRHSEYDFPHMKTESGALTQPKLDLQSPAERVAKRYVHLLDARGRVRGNNQKMVRETGKIATFFAGERGGR
jgi:hypothetical protein